MSIPASRVPLLVACLALVAACSFGGTQRVDGSGNPAEETRSVGEFSSVGFALPGTLVIEQSETVSLRIVADDNLLDHIRSEVRDGELRLNTDRINLEPRSPLRVYVSAPNIVGISSAGTGDVEAARLRTRELSLSLAGTGSARLPDLEVDVLRIQGAGVGNVHVSGTARQQVISLAGAGSVDAAGLESESVEASIAGAGSALVRVRDRLSANLVGSGSVRYHGDPEVTTSRIGVGRVEKIH